MGSDENTGSQLILKPKNPDGTYGDPVEWYGLKPLIEFPETTTYTEKLSFLNKRISGTFKIDNMCKKISRKKFKKWLMSKGINRDLADWFCIAVKSFHGERNYRSLYFCGLFASGPQALFNNLFDALFPI